MNLKKLLIGSVITSVSGFAFAGSSSIKTFEDLSNLTDVVIEGSVSRIDTAIDQNSVSGISTYITLSHAHAHQGNLEDNQIVVKMPGGTYKGVSSVIGGKLDIDEEDTVLLFLSEKAGEYSLVSKGFYRLDADLDNNTDDENYDPPLYDIDGAKLEHHHNFQRPTESFPDSYNEIVSLIPESTFKSNNKTFTSTLVPEKESLRRYGKLRHLKTDDDWDYEFFTASEHDFNEMVHRLAEWQGIGINEAAIIMRNYDDKINALRKEAVAELDEEISKVYEKATVQSLSKRIVEISIANSKPLPISEVQPPIELDGES